MHEISNNPVYEIMEKVIIEGDLSKLSPKERIEYYNKVCESLNLNPLTRPLSYVKFDGKMILYVGKDATEQLRKINKVSIVKLEKEVIDGVIIFTAYATNGAGQSDVSTGAVAIKGLSGKALSNAIKIAETQAKRRVTLSICGLGWSDESEIADIPKAEKVEVNYVTGEIEHNPMPTLNEEDALLDERLDAILNAIDMDVLKNTFTVAANIYADNPVTLKLIVEAKDKRKLALQGINYDSVVSSQ